MDGTVNYYNFFIDISDFEVTERIECHHYDWKETPFWAVRLRHVFHDPIKNKDVEIIRWMTEKTYNYLMEQASNED